MTYYVHAELDSIEAQREAVGPALAVRFKLNLVQRAEASGVEIPPDSGRLDISNIQGQLAWYIPAESGRYESLFLSAGVAHPSYFPFQSIQTTGDAAMYSMIFPFSRDQLAWLEELRAVRPDGKARFRMTICVTGHVTYRTQAMGLPPKSATGSLTYAALRENPVYIEQYRPAAIDGLSLWHGSKQYIEVEKSKWVDEVLPALGWGQWRTFEVPLAQSGGEMGKVDDWLRESERQFNLGDWAASLTDSRRAIEAMRPYFEKFINPVHTQEKGPEASQKAKQLSEAFEEWAKSTMGLSEKVRLLLHAGAHDVPAGATLERADAELGLTFAVEVRRYIGLRMM